MDFREFLTIASGDDHTAARAAWEALSPDDRALVERFLSRAVVFNPYAGEEADAGRDRFRAMMLDLGQRRASAQEVSEAIKKFEDDLAAIRAARIEASPHPKAAARLQRLDGALMLRAYVWHAAYGKMDSPQPVEKRQELAFRQAWMPRDIRQALAWFTIANVRRWGRSSQSIALVDPAIPGSAAFNVAEDLFGFNVPTPTEAP